MLFGVLYQIADIDQKRGDQDSADRSRDGAGRKNRNSLRSAAEAVSVCCVYFRREKITLGV